MKRIEKNKFYEKLNGMIGEYRVFAPSGDRYRYIEDVSEIKFDGLLTEMSPKAHFLPQEEELFRWDEKENIKVKDVNDRYIVFGMRPCEVRAVTLLDPTFDTEKFPDPYYINRRKNTIIISIACNEPLETCFCTSFGYGPFTKGDADLMLVDMGDYFLGEGDKDILNLFGFTDSEEDYKELKEKAESRIGRIEIEGIPEKLEQIRETDFFKKITQRCITCGTCTFLCPTCYCFDIQDRNRLNGGKRVRVWDSCMFKIYTHETSGHNPRYEEHRRMRQRVMHKFAYYPSLYNQYGCVGCGRCVTYCPVNFDIREVIREAGGYNG